MGIGTEFIDGQRVTTREVMRVVEMVLRGEINSEIVSLLNSHGGKAIGIIWKRWEISKKLVTLRF